MNANRDADTILAAWLDDGPLALPNDTRRAIAVGLRTTPQRRGRFGWVTGPRGWMLPKTLRTAFVAGALVLVVVAAIVVLQGRLPSLLPAASPSPSPTPVPLPTYSPDLRYDSSGRDGRSYPDLDPGSHSAGDEFPIALTFEVPDGPTDTSWWGFNGSSFAFLHGIDNTKWPSGRTQYGLFMWAATELAADMCQAGEAALGGPAVATSDDLLRLLAELPCITTSVSEGAVGRHRASHVELAWECPAGLDSCGMPVVPAAEGFPMSLECHDFGARRCEFLVVDVSPPLVVQIQEYRSTVPELGGSEVVREELDLILDSIRLAPRDTFAP